MIEPTLRLITWNCHHGRLAARLADLQTHAADIVFIQECHPAETLPFVGQVVTRRVNDRKGIALASLNTAYELSPVRARRSSGDAVIAAHVRGPVSFLALGIWSHHRDYSADVMRSVHAYRALLRSGPAVVMGDLNIGVRLDGPRAISPGHSSIVDTLGRLGLVSAYHAFHGVEHGLETHATYCHRAGARTRWHIDFCFVPVQWTDRLVAVNVLDEDHWPHDSDHSPLCVDLRL
jgi:endonuclease/exonuclease/phosphatase family metal-dependent hydrolase